MKLRNRIIFSILTISPLFIEAQIRDESSSSVKIFEPVDFYITQPLRDYPKFDPMSVPKKEHPRGKMLSGKRQKKADFLKTVGKSPSKMDPLTQTDPQTRFSSGPIQNFSGITTNASPPDPSAGVGPNHVVQMVNTAWSVWDKTGVQASGFPKSTADPLGSTFSDPIVLYDREADRWLISILGSLNQFKVAVSTTNDPTGSYAVYTFASEFNDYVKFGIYGNNYVLTGNFNPNGRFYALNREKMITGDPSAEIASLTMPEYISGTAFQAPQTAHSEGAGIASGPTPIVWFQDDAWNGVSNDHIKIWDFEIDWTNPEAATVSTPHEIALADFDSFIEGTNGDAFANIAQPGTTQRIDALVHVLNYQVHRYDFGTHQSIVLNFVVEPVDESKISGLRWAELRKTETNPWELYQEGTYVDPMGNESVFLGAMGMDQQGNIGMAYNKSGNTTFPSLYYTGRLSTDPLGMMTVSETLIIEGISTADNSRYGDYSQLTRDPMDDITFWFTGEHSGSAGGRKTQIASFMIGEPLSVDELNSNNAELVITSMDNQIFNLSLLSETTSDILRLSIYDIGGKRVIYEQVSKENNFYNKTIDLSESSTGVYIVEIGNSKTKLHKKILVK